jgi:hypothetical protein
MELSAIGNAYHIRHHETKQIPLESSLQIDWLFHRMWALICLLLKSSGRW